MSEERKLKRGLKDISPLFNKKDPAPTEEKITPCRPETMNIISVYNPSSAEKSAAYTHRIASHLATEDYHCSIFSIKTRFHHTPLYPRDENHSSHPAAKVRHAALEWSKFEKILSSSDNMPKPNYSPRQLLFLNFDFNHMAYLEKLFPIIDKWILIVRPTLDSLGEAYKMIKATRLVSTHLEYFLMFEEEMSDEKASFLFERYSEMVSRQLGVGLVWLGNISNNAGTQRKGLPLALDHLFLDSAETRLSAAKMILSNYAHSIPEVAIKNVS